MTLPIKTTADDVRRLVEYLGTKPAGVALKDAKTVLDSKVLDGRKVRAYTSWKIVKDADGQMRLDDRGWKLVRKPEESATVYQEVIDGVKPYRAAIEWSYHQGFDTITVNDVAAYWIEHHTAELGTENEETAKAAVNCFFSLAEAASLGRYVLGRRNNPTRLEFNKDQLAKAVQSGPTTPPWTGEGDGGADEGDRPPGKEDARSTGKDGKGEGGEATPPPAAPQQDTTRVFIAHGKNMDLVEQVETILGMVDIESVYAEAEESPAIPVPEKVLEAMRRCNSGIICVSVEEGSAGDDANHKINENVLIEIGAAFVLYDKRVVLLWDRRLPVPSNLQGLYRCEFEGNELNWSSGMKLMKALKGFKS